MTTTSTPPPLPQHQQSAVSSALSLQPWPLYDRFLDLPHPAASISSPKPYIIPSPVVSDNKNNYGIAENEIQAILPQIARFAFPEYDETAPASPTKHAASDMIGSATTDQAQLLLNKYDFYAMQNESFKQFTFTLQLQSGQRLHGHVRRYLPPHLSARTRYDVGRRGERALVILTRATGADLLYSAMLKSIEAISSQQAALSVSGMTVHNGTPQQWFLHQLSNYQQYLSKMYNERQPPNERGRPLIASISGLELGIDHEIVRTKFKNCDMSNFIIPTSLLVWNNMNPTPGSKVPPPHSSAAGSILPLFRCIGVAHALRIMAALLSERRVILVSSSPTRLASCSHGAVSALAVGLLHWQHLYIPVLPPHLWQYLAAPYPYLIGILSNTFPRLNRTDGLGEVLIINLDTNQMETRGMDTNTILQRLPDLFQTTPDTLQNQIQNSRPLTASEELGRDLLEILKEDKKVLYGESTLNRVSEKAAVATKVVKQTFLKIRDKGRQYLQNRIQSGNTYEGSQVSSPDVAIGEDDGPVEDNSMATDYVYTESCHNEGAEQEARIAFTSFFLSILGDMKWYLSTPPGQQLPALDRNKFLQSRRSLGDGDGTPMWSLLNNLCQTQMLEEFVKTRVSEVNARLVVAADMPLFLQCTFHCRQHNLDFSLMTCRRISRQLADGSPARLTGLLQTNARRTAMTLTSNKGYEGDYEQAIAKLVEESRESTSILFDVMSVIWLRLRDCKGMQWKHGHQALQLLRNLLYHGPLAAISEATDGLSKIRALKFYDNIRAQHANEIRSSAVLVYDLLVDRAKLFQIRRVCANRRRILQSRTEPARRREVNATIGTPFRNVHALMHPSASSGTVVQLPPKPPKKVTMDRGGENISQKEKAVPANDLLDGGSHSANNIVTGQLTDFFDSVAISSPSNGTTAGIEANPFSTFAPVQSVNPGSVAPTIAQLPTHSSHQPVHHQGQVTHFGLPQGIIASNPQGHAPQFLSQNPQGHSPHFPNQTLGHPGQSSQNVYANIPQHQPHAGTYQPQQQQGTPVFHQHPNQGPHQAYTQQQTQRPPSSNMSLFDPLAKR